MPKNAFNLKYLQEHSLFGGVAPEKIRLILPLLGEADFPAGAEVIREGEFEDRIYFLLKGSVEVIKSVPSAPGKLRRLALIPAGETFGEMEFIEPERCTATIRALEPLQALTLSNAALYQVFRTDPETFTLIMLNLSRLVVRRMRKLQEILVGPCAPE